MLNICWMKWYINSVTESIHYCRYSITNASKSLLSLPHLPEGSSPSIQILLSLQANNNDGNNVDDTKQLLDPVLGITHIFNLIWSSSLCCYCQISKGSHSTILQECNSLTICISEPQVCQEIETVRQWPCSSWFAHGSSLVCLYFKLKGSVCCFHAFVILSSTRGLLDSAEEGRAERDLLLLYWCFQLLGPWGVWGREEAQDMWSP